MKQMTKDEMMKLYFRTVNDIIALDKDFTRVGETIAYERLMARKELLGEDLLFTKVGWIYQYNAIPNNKDNQLTNYFMKKTYEHFYGELNENNK